MLVALAQVKRAGETGAQPHGGKVQMTTEVDVNVRLNAAGFAASVFGGAGSFFSGALLLYGDNVAAEAGGGYVGHFDIAAVDLEIRFQRGERGILAGVAFAGEQQPAVCALEYGQAVGGEGEIAAGVAERDVAAGGERAGRLRETIDRHLLAVGSHLVGRDEGEPREGQTVAVKAGLQGAAAQIQPLFGHGDGQFLAVDFAGDLRRGQRAGDFYVGAHGAGGAHELVGHQMAGPGKVGRVQRDLSVQTGGGRQCPAALFVARQRGGKVGVQFAEGAALQVEGEFQVVFFGVQTRVQRFDA